MVFYQNQFELGIMPQVLLRNGTADSFSDIRLAAAPSLCLARASLSLQTQSCAYGSPAQFWRFLPTPTPHTFVVQNPPSHLCVTAIDGGVGVGLAPCRDSDGDMTQAWLYGTGGRLCNGKGRSSLCLSVGAT